MKGDFSEKLLLETADAQGRTVFSSQIPPGSGLRTLPVWVGDWTSGAYFFGVKSVNGGRLVSGSFQVKF